MFSFAATNRTTHSAGNPHSMLVSECVRVCVCSICKHSRTPKHASTHSFTHRVYKERSIVLSLYNTCTHTQHTSCVRNTRETETYSYSYARVVKRQQQHNRNEKRRCRLSLYTERFALHHALFCASSAPSCCGFFWLRVCETVECCARQTAAMEPLV